MSAVPPKNNMAAARAAKAAKAQRLKELEEEELRRRQEQPTWQEERMKEITEHMHAPSEVADEDDSFSESEMEEEPMPIPKKRKRQREVIVQPYSDPAPKRKEPAPKKPKSNVDVPPASFTMAEHATNFLYATAPMVGHGLLLFFGLMVTVASQMPVKVPVSADHTPAAREMVPTPAPPVHRNPDDYSLF